MSNQLSLTKREETGKKLRNLRDEGMIPSVVYGGEEPIMTVSSYNETDKVLREVGYHSAVELGIDGGVQLAIVKNIDIDPVSRRILNVEFQAISADKVVEATTPIKVLNFDQSEAAKKHFVLQQVLEEVEVKARPSDLPEEIIVDGKGLATTEDKLTLADLEMPEGVELADKELAETTVVATVYDPAVEAAAREAEDSATETENGDADSTETNKGDSAEQLVLDNQIC